VEPSFRVCVCAGGEPSAGPFSWVSERPVDLPAFKAREFLPSGEGEGWNEGGGSSINIHAQKDRLGQPDCQIKNKKKKKKNEPPIAEENNKNKVTRSKST